MITVLSALAFAVVALTAVSLLAWQGFRNGDRPDDAPIAVALRSSGQPGEERPVALVAIGNPGRAAVLAAVAVRPARPPARLAAWLTPAAAVAVPRRTARRGYRPDRFPTVGIVPPGQRAELAAPVPVAASRYLVLVLVGQAGGRLRVHRLRIEAARSTPAGPAPQPAPGPGARRCRRTEEGSRCRRTEEGRSAATDRRGSRQ